MYLFFIIIASIFLNINGQNVREYSVDFPHIAISDLNGYDCLSFSGCSYNTDEGSPQIPFKKMVIPLNRFNSIDSISIASVSLDTVDGKFTVYPVQRAKTSDYFGNEFTNPSESEYSKDFQINLNPIKIDFISNSYDNNFAVLSLFPVRYNPREREIVVLKSISFKIYSSMKYNASTTDKTLDEKNLLDLTENSAEINYEKPIFDSIIELVVIIDTSDIKGEDHGELLSLFDDFIFWKNKIGIPTKIYTLDFIENSFPFDNPEDQIKNFIKGMNEFYSTKYVLLAGEDDIDIDDISFSYAESDVGDWMPRKDIFLFDASAGVTDDDTMISDYWYGDINDDLFPDVSIGRILFDEYANAYTACSTFVYRTIKYEKDPPSGYLNKMLLSSEEIFASYFGKTVSESLSAVNPSNMTDIKYYDEDGNYDKITTLNEINSGVGIFHTASHGSTYCHMLASGNPITTADVETYLDVNDKFYIFFGYPCFLGSFDYDSYIEHIMSNANTGAVASMANSRYGFVDINFPGRSDYQSLWFVKAFSQEGYFRIGDAKKRMNERSAVYALTDPFAKYCLMEYNLYGDPTLMIWTDEPTDIFVFYPDTITSLDPIAILVYESDKSTAIGDALVTIWGKQDKNCYFRDRTDMSGGVILPFNSLLSTDSVYITVVAHNRKIHEGIIILHLNSPSVPLVSQPLNNVKTTNTKPVISFVSKDSNNRNLKYRIIMSKFNNFSAADTFFTNFYPSGSKVNYTVSSNLENQQTYFFTVSAINTDNLISKESDIITFTVADDLILNTLSWFKTDSLQFEADSAQGTLIELNEISLGHSDTMLFEVIFDEDFEYNNMPSNWLVVDGNNDGYKFRTGQSAQKALKGFDPPDMGTYYCYYADSDVRQSYTNADEYLYTASYCCETSETLKFYCGYGFYSTRAGETFTLELRKFTGGSWTSSEIIYYFPKNATGALSFNLSDYLPAESIKVFFHYKNPERKGGAVAVNNIRMTSKKYPEIMSGTYKTEAVCFEDFLEFYPKMNWGKIKVLKNLPEDSILIHLEYQNGGIWKDIPDILLFGNSQGISTLTSTFDIDISNINPYDYDTIRLVSQLFRKEAKLLSSPSIKSFEIGIDVSLSTEICLLSLDYELFDKGVVLKSFANFSSDILLLYREDSRKKLLLKKFSDAKSGYHIFNDSSITEGGVYEYYTCAVTNEETIASPAVKVLASSLLSRITLKSNLISRRIILLSPVKTSMTIPVSIFDSSGRIVKNFNVSFKTKEEAIDASSFSSGIYFLKIGHMDGKMQKLTILKQ